jgi:hypothetical protein
MGINAQTGFVNGATAVAGGDLLEQAKVTTNGSGSIDFTLDKKISSCRVMVSSAVNVVPSAEVLLSYVGGTTWCSTKANPGKTQLLAPGVEITMKDPLFGVSVDGSTVLVKVQSGIVFVRSVAPGITDGGQLVGPGSQTIVEAGKVAAPPEIFDPARTPELEQSAVAALAALMPPPVFVRPDPAGSATIGRIIESGQLVVAVDETSIDPTSLAFVNAFIAFEADTWGIKAAVEPMPLEPAVEALVAGRVQLVLSRQGADGTTGIPFFSDQEGSVWSLFYASQDETFGRAEQAFLTEAVTSGRYADRFLAAFGAAPRYDALQALVGP